MNGFYVLRSAYILVLVIIYVTGATKIPIGALFDDPATLRIIQQNFGSVGNKDETTFDLLSEKVDGKDSYQVLKAASRVLKRGAIVLIVPSTFGGYSALPPLSSNVQIPLISLSEREDEDEALDDFLVSLKPVTLNAALQVMRFYKWDNLVYLYDRDDGPSRFDFLLQRGFGERQNQVRSLNRVTRAEAGAAILRNLEVEDGNASKLKIVLDLEASLAEELLSLYSRGTQTNTGHHFILMSPMDDIYWKKNREQRLPLKVTGFQIYDAKTQDVSRFLKSFSKSEQSKTMALLAADAVQLIGEGLTRLAQNQHDIIEESKGFYTNASSKLPNGETIRKAITQTYLHEGLTGQVVFNDNGQRIGYNLSVIESSLEGVKHMFFWNEANGLTADHGVDLVHKSSLSGGKFRVTTTVTTPYTVIEKIAGQEILTGFCKDLMDHLANVLNFEYELKPVADGKYGTVNDKGEWTGMIGEIMLNKSDIACSDLTITSTREKEVLFTTHFQTSGLSLMVKRPNLAPALGPGSSDFFFFHVFSPEAWGSILAAIAISGLLYYGISRFTARTVDQVTGDLSGVGPLDSLWFAYGSMMLRSLGYHPGSTSARFVTAIWWLFVFFTCVAYVGGLTAMLLCHYFGNPELRFDEALINTPLKHILRDYVNKGSPLVGMVQGGSTNSYFVEQFGYRHYLKNNPRVLTNSYQEGIERVLSDNGKYVFLMDSTTNEYHSQRNCELDMYRSLEFVRGFGLAISKENVRYLSDLNAAIMRSIETGKLNEIKDKWWKSNITCYRREPTYKDLYHSSVTLQDVGGIFYCLVVGVILTFFVTGAEYCVERRRRPEVSLTRVTRGELTDDQDDTSFL